MIILGKLGRDEGRFNGPPAGDGATEAGRPGYHDVDGTPSDELPQRAVESGLSERIEDGSTSAPGASTSCARI